MEKYINQAHEMALFTSGQVMVWDKDGNQIRQLQIEFNPGNKKRELLSQVIENCEVFNISCFREWNKKLSKDEIKGLLML